MIGLEDCGKELLLTFVGYSIYQTNVKVTMIIKAPRGCMALFETAPASHTINAYYGSHYFTFPNQTKQCQAIKAFMKEHRNDKAEA